MINIFIKINNDPTFSQQLINNSFVPNVGDTIQIKSIKGIVSHRKISFEDENTIIYIFINIFPEISISC